MTAYANIALTIWLIPLGLFALLALVHKRAFFPQIRDKLATGGMGVCLALSIYLLAQAWGQPAIPIENARLVFEWLPFSTPSGEPILVGMMVDNLTIVMLCVVTLVSFLVYLFSIGYMKGDDRYGRYYCCLLIFSASMIGLVLADNFLFLYVFWELVGFSSYLLIGHWFEKKSAADAALKAFITTRIGDIGMFLGILIIHSQVGSFAFDDVFRAVADGTLAGNWRTLAGLGIFFGAVGKSAQFPLHCWLPDAMEGPTPVSALIHAATMVAAGVYLVGRAFLLFDDPTFLVIACTGAVTAFIAATIALVQDDIKKVLAYSTVSQLGYMMLALGVGGYVAGLFHLTTHACFKACLFLGSGSVIYAMHHEQRMSQYGGLFKKMKITALTFLASCLAIAGFPYITAGFYSKDMILGDTLLFAMREGEIRAWIWLLPVAGFGTAFLTAFYMFRQYYLTFTGKPRNQEKFDHAHESPWTMTVPLIILGSLAIVAGGFHFSENIKFEWFQPMIQKPDIAVYMDHGHAPEAVGPTLLSGHDADHKPVGPTLLSGEDGHETDAHLAAAPAALEEHHAEAAAHDAHGDHLAHQAHENAKLYSIILALSGIFMATLMYWKGLTGVPAFLASAFKPILTFLWNKWYFDELYAATLIRLTMVCKVIAFWFDSKIVDGIINLVGRLGLLAGSIIGVTDKWGIDGLVNALAWASQGIGGSMARLQTGRVRGYLFALVVGVAVVAAVLIVL